MPDIVKKLATWIVDRVKNGLKNKATTTVAGGFLVGALVQLGYNFDHDPNTVTNWDTFLNCLLGAAGFVVVPDAGKNNTPPPTTLK